MARSLWDRSPGDGRPGPEIHVHTMKTLTYARFTTITVVGIAAGALYWLSQNNIPMWAGFALIMLLTAVAGVVHRIVGQSDPPRGDA